MTLKLIVHPIVDEDLEGLTQYIAQQNVSSSLKFANAVEQSYQFLLSFPESGEMWENDNPRCRNLRIWPVQDFPNHLIFYRVKGESLEVVRIIHGARDYSKLF